MREIDPIKRKRTKAIKDKSYLFRINSLGFPVLKNKQITLKNHHYDLVKLTNYEEDYGTWKKEKANNYRLCEETIKAFITSEKETSLKNLYLKFLLEKEEKLTHEERFILSLEEAIKKMVGESLATSLFQKNEASLKEFTFKRIYSSQNKQYIFDRVNMGTVIDAWGMREGSSTLIDIKSLSHEEFLSLKEKMKGFSFPSNDNLECQTKLAQEKPLSFYPLQMKLMCTGFSQAILYFVNRNTFDTQAFFMRKDKACFDWFLKVDKEHKKILNHFLEIKSLAEREKALNSYFKNYSSSHLDLPYEKNGGEKDFLLYLENRNRQQIKESLSCKKKKK